MGYIAPVRYSHYVQYQERVNVPATTKLRVYPVEKKPRIHTQYKRLSYNTIRKSRDHLGKILDEKY